MADYLDAAGNIPGDVEKIRKALYGREVRASIAEAIELLDAQDTKRDDTTAELEQKFKDLVTLENADKMGFSAQDTVEFAAAAGCLKHSIEGDAGIFSAKEVSSLAGGFSDGRVQR